MGEVLRLFVCAVHRLPMREVEAVSTIVDKGFEGCAHGRPGSRRQVLLMDIETLEQLGVAPGSVKENITTRGLELVGLRAGQRLQVGEALLEVTAPCEPCARMDEIRPGLQQELCGRRGMLCRVVGAGLVRCGDRIELVNSIEGQS